MGKILILVQTKEQVKKKQTREVETVVLKTKLNYIFIQNRQRYCVVGVLLQLL